MVNPAAGSGRARGFWRRCAEACHDLTLEVVETRRRGDAADYAAAAGDRLVIAVGGDGTAHEVVNGLLRRPTARPPRVGFLQRGTGADLRRSVASPRRPEDVAAWLTSDRWRPLDAGRLSTSTGRRYFINVADAGIGAEIVRRAARGPGLFGGTVNFLGAAVVSLLRHRNTLVRLRLDEGTARTWAGPCGWLPKPSRMMAGSTWSRLGISAAGWGSAACRCCIEGHTAGCPRSNSEKLGASRSKVTSRSGWRRMGSWPARRRRCSRSSRARCRLSIGGLRVYSRLTERGCPTSQRHSGKRI
ncbi:MAG: hypothetical protein E6I10_05140 [Chloroflexi bacterium]|nr:MAG: hypothetical protein E6I10_05140 [Chloroflexota bacterium]